MKSKHDIKQRITQLETSQKNWVDNNDTIKLLNWIINFSSEDITTLLQLNIEMKNYKIAKELMWVLEEETNIWFSE